MKESMTRSLLVHLICFALVLSVSFLASSASAQYVTGPGAAPPTPPGNTTGGAPDPSHPGGVITGIKTPKLHSGDPISIPILVHNSSGVVLPNWAGVLVEVHLADPREVDITGIRVGGVPVAFNPFIPNSGPGSTVATFPVFHPSAILSGVNLQPSSSFPAITLDLIAKNTSLTNSDVDIGLRFADIYHQPGVTYVNRVVHTATTTIHLTASPGSTFIQLPTPGSTTWHWQDSHRVLVSSSIQDLQNLHLDANGQYHGVYSNIHTPFPNAPPTLELSSKYAIPRGANPETGHFIHFPAGIVHRVTSSILFHNIGRSGSTIVPKSSTWATTYTAYVPGSQIIAVPFLATATIGIEHIPEPAAPVLLLGGLASLVCGLRARRRRQQLT